MISGFLRPPSFIDLNIPSYCRKNEKIWKHFDTFVGKYIFGEIRTVASFGTDLKQLRDFVKTYDTLWYFSERIHYFCPSSFLPQFVLMIPYGTSAKVSPIVVLLSFYHYLSLWYLMVPRRKYPLCLSFFLFTTVFMYDTLWYIIVKQIKYIKLVGRL